MIIVLSVLMMTGGLSCSDSPQYTGFTSKLALRFQKTTLEGASNTLGVSLPVPTYLTEGLQIQQVYIAYFPEGASEVILFISDKGIEEKLVTNTEGIPQYYELRSKMRFTIRWGESGPPGIKLPGESVSINGKPGKILSNGETHSLVWQWRARERGVFETILAARKDMPKEELIRVAESVSQ